MKTSIQIAMQRFAPFHSNRPILKFSGRPLKKIQLIFS
jgi:hypothetical protein